MVLDEEMGYDTPREQLKGEVLNFVDGYFEETAAADHFRRQEEESPWTEM